MSRIQVILNRITYIYTITGVTTFSTVLISNFATINRSGCRSIFQTDSIFASVLIIAKAIYYGCAWPQFIYDTYKKPSSTLRMDFYDVDIDNEEENDKK